MIAVDRKYMHIVSSSLRYAYTLWLAGAPPGQSYGGPCGYGRAMRAEQADVVIIGAGLAGSAAARALASRGRSVVLLEAFQPGHRRASSHGSARIFRRAYADPLYVRLTGQAQVLWRQLADEAGEEFVDSGRRGRLRPFAPAGEDARDHDWAGGASGADAGRGGGRTVARHLVRPRAGHVPPGRRGHRPGARHGRDARDRRRAWCAGLLRLAGPARRGRRRRRDGAHRRPVVARADGGRGRRGMAGTAARRAGAAAAAGRDPGRCLPLRVPHPPALARVHLVRRHGQVRPARRAGRRSPWRDQGRRARRGRQHHRRRPGRGCQRGGQGPGPRVRRAAGCPAWTRNRSAR